jgi:hypothetical protein
MAGRGLGLQWLQPGAQMGVALFQAPQPYPCQAIAVRIGQIAATEGFEDIARGFTLRVFDSSGRWADVPSSAIAPLEYPRLNMVNQRQAVLQTLRFPLRLYSDQGIDCTNIYTIMFLFGSADGEFLMDDLQFTY